MSLANKTKTTLNAAPIASAVVATVRDSASSFVMYASRKAVMNE
jgi:hypothetical protein